jgi:hypothetical protein
LRLEGSLPNINPPFMNVKAHFFTAACAVIALASAHTASAQGTKSSPSPAAHASPAASAAGSPAGGSSTATKAPRAIPMRGTATAVDQSGKTFTIAGKSASRVFKASDQTTITKGGNAATFADLTENEAVTGSYWKRDDGTLELKSLKIGGKTDAEKAKSSSKKSKKGAEENSSTSEE